LQSGWLKRFTTGAVWSAEVEDLGGEGWDLRFMTPWQLNNSGQEF
jgi:hypothetical protein